MLGIRKLLLAAVAMGAVSALTAPAVYASQASSEKHEQKGGIFTDDDRQIIRDFFDHLEGKDQEKSKHKDKGAKGKSGSLPPGLAKKDELPPGLQKQLEKNGTLPPGLAKRNLPDDLESRLSRLPKHLERIIVGEDILLIERGVGLILDIMKGGAK